MLKFLSYKTGPLLKRPAEGHFFTGTMLSKFSLTLFTLKHRNMERKKYYKALILMIYTPPINYIAWYLFLFVKNWIKYL